MTRDRAGGRSVPFDIRPPRTTDLARLEAIENAADERFQAVFEPVDSLPAGAGEARAAMPGFVLVASERAGGEPVGFVHVLEADGLAHLEQLSVLPASGQRGLGTALLSAAMALAGSRGHSRMTLRTYADVPWNAPFYASHGFVESEPDTPFLLGLLRLEQTLGLTRYGRRIQMTAPL